MNRQAIRARYDRCREGLVQWIRSPLNLEWLVGTSGEPGWRDLIAVLSAAAIVRGVWMYSNPAGWIVAGIMGLIAAMMAAAE